jgi:hypothetical protein
MKKSLYLFLLYFIVYLPSSAQTDEAEVQRLILMLDSALVKKDSLQLQKLLTADFTGIIPSGRAFRQAEYIRYHCTPNRGIIALHESEGTKSITRIDDHVAIVHRKVRARLKKPDGSIHEAEIQRLEVCFKQENHWKLVSGQGTEINPSLRP